MKRNSNGNKEGSQGKIIVAPPPMMDERKGRYRTEIQMYQFKTAVCGLYVPKTPQILTIQAPRIFWTDKKKKRQLKTGISEKGGGRKGREENVLRRGG